MANAALQVIPGGKSGDARDDLRALYQRYGGAVFGRCLYLLKDRTRAEDAMQDVFARALQHQSGYRHEASPLTWLMKIATHHCLNLLRSERAAWRRMFEREERSRPVAVEGAAAMEIRDLVRTLLSKFDVETQAAAVHYHVDEMTLEEVATLLGRSVPTIRKRLENFARVSGQELKS